MNPQFPNMGGNMGGMGRGMPNNMQQMGQMNPAFLNQQMGNVMRGQPGMAMQAGAAGPAQQMGMGNAQLHRQIFQALQSQGNFSGWQAAVPLQERAAQIRQLVDSLRLVRPPVDPNRAVDVAIQFERKSFAQSANKEDYIRECNEKLARIRDERARQFASMQEQQQGGMAMQNPAFMQQQMGQNMNMNQAMGLNPGQQQQQQQLQQNMFNQQQQQNIQQNAMMQTTPAAPAQQMSTKPTEALSHEDNLIINQRAAELAKSTPKDKMRSIVDNMNAQLRQNLEARKIDPIIYYFRMMATREFRKQKELEGRAQNPAAQQNQMGQGQPQMSNDMGRFQNQQNEALRLQQEGDMVVPASNNQGMITDHMRLQQQMMANPQRMGQQNPNQAALLERQRMMQIQANKMQQASQFRQQQGGQNVPPNQTPQPAGAQLNMLNQPVGANVQGPSPQTSRPPSRVPQQPGQQGMAQMSMQEQQKREQALAKFPPQLQNALRTKPTNEWQQIIAAFQQSINMKRSASQQAAAAQQQPNQTGQFMPAPQPMQQSLSAGSQVQPNMNPNMQGMNMQNQAQMTQELMRQRAMQQQQRQQQQQMQGDQMKASPPVQQLTQEQMHGMDRVAVPASILAPIRNNTSVPLPTLQGLNWYTLKQWAQQNPIPNISMGQLLRWQATHYHTHRAKQQQGAQANAMMQGQMPQQQMPQQQHPAGVPGQQAMPQPQMPNDAEIQRLRQQYPKLAGMSDTEVRRAFINKQRQAMAQGQMAMQANRQGMPGQQVQGAPMAQMAQQQANVMQANRQAMQQPQPPQMQLPQGQIARPQGQGQQKPQQQPQPAHVPQQQPGPQMPKGPPQNVPPEKWNAMTPQQQQQVWMQHQRQQNKQKLVHLIMHMTKQVNQAMANKPVPKLDANQQQRLRAKLGSDNVKQMLGRVDQFLVAFFEMNQDEQERMKMVEYRNVLFRQFSPQTTGNKTFIPADTFTITPEEADSMLSELSTRFQRTAAQIPKQQTQQQQQQAQQQQKQPQLTGENLKQLEAQEQRKKSIGNKPPAAPTDAQAPFSFAKDPHGAAKYAAPGLKQEDLKLDPKRRKKNPPATPSTTVQTPVATAPAATSPPKPAAPPAPPAPKYKCVFKGCEYQTKGFATQAELDTHTTTAHGMSEIKDPEAFFEESLREAFNLDENFQQIKKPTPKVQAQAMQRTPSQLLKAESHPSTPSAMARIPSTNSAAPTLPAILTEDEQAWTHSNIQPDQLKQIFDFDSWDWSDYVPSFQTCSHRKILDRYMESDEWKSMLVPVDSESPETNAGSASPPADKDREPAKTAADCVVDLSELDVGVDSDEFEKIAASDADSPFEVVDAMDVDSDGKKEPEKKKVNNFPPDCTAFKQIFKNLGMTQDTPYDEMSVKQKEIHDFITAPVPAVRRRGFFIAE
jgi:hypothetical protein